MEITKVKIKLRNKALRDNGGYYGSAAAALLPSLSDYVTGDYLIENYVAKEAGKGLSANNFTDDLLAKLNGIEAGANKYVHPTAAATTIAAAAGRVLSAISVNSLGHVTSVSSKVLAASDIPTLGIAKISGLQDALNSMVSQSDFDTFKNLFDSMFEKVTENGVTSIKAKYGLWTNEFLSCLGLNSSGSGGSGGGFGLMREWPATAPLPTTNDALGANLGYDLWLNKAEKSTVNAIASRVTTLEGKNYLDALNLVTSGSGNAVTGVSLSADKKTLTASYGNRVMAVPSANNVHFNNIATYGNAMGMAGINDSSPLVSPNGQTGWHHFINISYAVSGQETNMWQTQIANKAGTTDLWVRSRDGGALSDSTAWKAPWTRILTGTNYTSVLDTRYYTKSEVDTKDKRLTTYYAVRPASANVNFGNAAGLYTFLATSAMTTGKPAVDSHILHMEWDNSLSFAAQLALPAGVDANMQWRWQHNTTWQAWRTLLDTNNYAGTLDTRYVTLNTAQTIAGVKTFASDRASALYVGNTGVTSPSDFVAIKFMHTGAEIGGIASSKATNMLYRVNGEFSKAWMLLDTGNYAATLDTRYVTLDTAQMITAQKTGGMPGASWVNGRDNALLRIPKPSAKAYYTLFSIKTPMGSWELGNHTDERLLLTHISDSNYNVNANIFSTQFSFNSNGTFTATSFVKSGGTSSQFLMADGSVKSLTDITSAYVTALGTSGDYLTWTKNGVVNNITVPFATTAARLIGFDEHTGTGLSNFDTTCTRTYQATNDLGDGISYVAILSVSAGSVNRYFQIIGGKGNTSYLRWRTTNADASAMGPVHRILDDLNYAAILDSRYLKLTGGTITGSTGVPLIVNTTYQWESGIRFSTAGTSKGFVGYSADYGVILSNHACNKYIGVTSAGIPVFSGSTLLHAGNYASFLDSVYVNKAGDTMTGTLLAPRIDVGDMYWDGTGIMPSTIGHNKYVCGKADGRWANVFTRTINVTSTDLVSNLNADMLDGFHKESFDGYRYTKIDASALDNNTWYPVVFRVPQALQTRIRIEGGSAANASWNGRSDKRMSVVLDYTVQGSEWGWVTPQRVINLFILGAGASGSNCIAGLGQLTNNSWEYVMVRGGAVYNFYISHWLVPELKTSTFTNQNQSVSPTTTSPTAITRNNAWITDNVASATKLAAARTLWGKSFNGTEDVDGSIRACQSGAVYQFLTYPTSPYGLRIDFDSSGCVKMQSRRELVSTEYFSLALNPSGGNVGIGTTSPAYKLDVNGIVRASDSIISTGWNQFRAIGGNYGFFIRNDGAHTYFMLTNSGDAYGSYNSLRPMYIVNSSGVVAFASSTLMVDPEGYASVQGELYASVGIYSDGFVSARGRNTSDVRLKTDLRDFRATDIIRSLRPVAFRWNELARSRFKVFDTDAVQYGLIAQEVMEVAPWLVDADMFKDGYMGVWYDRLIPVLLKGEIEILRVTEDHEERIKALERENTELRKEIIELQTR